MRRRPLTVAVVAGVVLVAGCGVAYAQTQNSSGSYRTAAAVLADVDKTLSLSGTITASARRDLSFGASGTVAKVKVAAGDVVRSGATLATLDATDLKTAVTKARAALAKARAQLESDQTSQASTVSAAASSSTPSSSNKEPSVSKDPSSSAPSKALAKALAQLKAQQTAVSVAQTSATEAIAAAKSALAAQVEACTGATEVTEPDVDDPDAAPTASLSVACTSALDAVQTAQGVVSAKQDTLQAALQALAGTLADAVKSVGTSEGSAGPSAGSTDVVDESSSAPASTAGSSPTSGSSGGSASSGVTVTAASLAKDQAAIDTARAELAEAKQARKAAELSAPFAGEVLSVSIAKGDAIGSSDVVIVMVGNGSTTATTSVSLDQVADVAKGQTAHVTPAGATKPVSGTVTSIGLLPDTSSDTSSYPVTIELDGDVAAPEGSSASIALVIGTAKNVLTVPSSAVSTTGRTTVSVLTDGTASRTPVAVGVVGSTRTEITDGLKRGQVVVLADLDAALPSGGSTSTRLPGSGGGFGGGGMAGGGRMPGGGRG